MKIKKIKRHLIFLFILLSLIIIPFTFSKYYQQFNRKITLRISKPTYTVRFNSNRNDGNQEETSTQEFIYGISQNLNTNSFVFADHYFQGWNTKNDGTGTSYIDEQEVLNLTSEDNGIVDLYAQWVTGIAEMNGIYYPTLKAAINAVQTDGIEATINLLANTDENLTIANGKNINLDLHNHRVCGTTTDPTFTNEGILKISNGTITMTKPNTGVINNNSKGNLTVTDVTIIMDVPGGKQAIYNDKGKLTIAGNSNLSSISTIRATVQNVGPGTLNILGGTIVSTGFHGVQNNGTLNIGTQDGNPDKTSPVIQGAQYGVNSTSNYSFYNGIIKGVTEAVNSTSKITQKETGYEIAHSEEIIDGVNYKEIYLSITNTVTFDPNGGTVSEETRGIESGNEIGTLPIPIRNGYIFDGWFTGQNDGTQIDEHQVINNDVTYFAHWTNNSVAEIDGQEFTSIQNAINSITDDTTTTIKLLKDTTEAFTVQAGKNIVFNFQNYTVNNDEGTLPVLTNNGNVWISNGTLTSDADRAVIDNNPGGNLYISGGNIISTGTRSSIYNKRGTVEISGNAYLSATAIERPVNAGLDRGTIHNIDNGTVIVKGGTIIGIHQYGIANEAILILGVKSDGNISTTSPNIRGETYGVANTRTFRYYDGIIKGINGAISGNITEREPNTQLINDTEQIDGKTYNTAHLEPNP